jgi:hypothetical protein
MRKLMSVTIWPTYSRKDLDDMEQRNSSDERIIPCCILDTATIGDA